MEKAAMSVAEFALMMGISLPKAYELAHRPDFPMIRVGRRIVIPKAPLEEWLKKEAKHENTEY